MLIRSPCAGDALDPLVWKFPIKLTRAAHARALSLSLSHLLAVAFDGPHSKRVGRQLRNSHFSNR